MSAVFKFPRPKKPTRVQIQSFWRIHDGATPTTVPQKKSPRWFDRTGIRKRAPVTVTPTTLGVVRSFRNASELKTYLQTITRTNRAIRSHRFDAFDLVPAHIFHVDRAHLRVLERVHRVPNLEQLMKHTPPDFESRYGKKFWKNINKKGADLLKMRRDLSEAIYELSEAMIARKIPLFDASFNNILVLDYDPSTGRAQLCITDH